MGLPRLLFYIGGRVIAGVLACLGFALDYTGGSILTISSANWGIIGLIASGVFVVLTLVREIDLVLQQKPKIKATPILNDNNYYLLVHNTGEHAEFKTTVKIKEGREYLENLTSVDSPVWKMTFPLNKWDETRLHIATLEYSQEGKKNWLLEPHHDKGIDEPQKSSSWGGETTSVSASLKSIWNVESNKRVIPPPKIVLGIVITSDPSMLKSFSEDYQLTEGGLVEITS